MYKLFVACATLFFLYFKAQQKKREIIKRLVYPKRAKDYTLQRGRRPGQWRVQALIAYAECPVRLS